MFFFSLSLYSQCYVNFDRFERACGGYRKTQLFIAVYGFMVRTLKRSDFLASALVSAVPAGLSGGNGSSDANLERTVLCVNRRQQSLRLVGLLQ